MPKPTVAVIVGSNRKESINRKYAQALVKLGADKFDAHFVRIDDLPLYNQDNEANPGDYGLIIGMGPGFSVELVLLKW